MNKRIPKAKDTCIDYYDVMNFINHWGISKNKIAARCGIAYHVFMHKMREGKNKLDKYQFSEPNFGKIKMALKEMIEEGDQLLK